MEQALAASAAWPYADEPPPDVAEGHRQRLREAPCGSLFALITRLIANGSPESKSAGCRAALQKEKDKMVAGKVWNEEAVVEWAQARVNDRDASVGRVFSIMSEKRSTLNDEYWRPTRNTRPGSSSRATTYKPLLE